MPVRYVDIEIFTPIIVFDLGLKALAGVAELAAVYGTDGVDLFFLNDHRYGLELKVSRPNTSASEYHANQPAIE